MGHPIRHGLRRPGRHRRAGAVEQDAGSADWAVAGGWVGDMRKELLALIAVLMLPILLEAVGWFFPNPVTFLFLLPMSTGLIPYLIFAAGYIFWGTNKSADEILMSSWFAPLFFSALLLPFVFYRHASTPWASNQSPHISTMLFVGVGYFIYGCAFGYLYVLIGRFLYRKILLLCDKLSK